MRLRKLSLLFALVALWQILAMWVLPAMDQAFVVLLAPPSALFQAAIELMAEGKLVGHILISSQRALIGFAVAAAIGVPLGLAMGWSTRLNNQLEPILEFLRPIPPIAWIPLSILWFGLSDTQKEFVIFLAAFYPILLNTIAGVRSIPPNLIRAALSLGAGRRLALFRKVVFYGALPNVFVGLRIGLGFAFMALVAAELVAAQSGLGFLINDARQFLQTDRVMLGMALIGLVGVLIDAAIRRFERLTIPWYGSAS